MGSLLGAEPSRPFLTTTPALPYPALLTPLFSFRMKKAGIDLPMRQFQGTLDPYKCLRPFLVAPLAAASLPFSLQNPRIQSQLSLPCCGHLMVYFSPWACKWSDLGLRAGILLRDNTGWAAGGLLASRDVPSSAPAAGVAGSPSPLPRISLQRPTGG